MPTILVVDDRIVNRQFLATLFAYAGHRVVQAADGVEALALARREPVDLVFSDILMPVLDGVELARRMRADPALAHIPVIFYTATYRQHDARKLAAECGVQEVLAKPSEPKIILDTVAQFVGPGERPAPGVAELPAPAPPSGQLVAHLAGYLDALAKLQEQLEQAIDQGQEVIGRGGNLRQLSYSLSDSFTTLQTVSLRLSAVIELGLELSSEREPSRLVKVFCRGAQDIVSARDAAVGVIGGEDGALEHLYTEGMGERSCAALHALLPRGGILGEIMAGGTATKVLAGNGSTAKLVVPIRSVQRTYGWAWFEAKLGAGNFSEEDEHFAVTLAAQFTLAYENLLLSGEPRGA
ncbi:MAG TPA: response regulator [Burkholderiales bacterium]|nr:response regulator [Burkholderiales bacterium]